MFLRFVQLKVDPERIPEMKDRYEQEIISELASVPGCLYAGLVRSTRRREQVVSVTLWETLRQAQEYEKSGLFSALVDKTRPYFHEADEWKLDLSEDLRLEYKAVPVEPVVKSYTGPSSAPSLDADNQHCPYFRFASMVVQPGRIEEFRSLYQNQVLPTLRNVPGCCYIQLAQNVEEPNEFISFTLWKSRQQADAYERSGMFTLLRDVLRPTLSELSQWQMDAEDDPRTVAATHEDMSVQSYTVITGKSFVEKKGKQ